MLWPRLDLDFDGSSQGKRTEIRIIASEPTYLICRTWPSSLGRTKYSKPSVAIVGTWCGGIYIHPVNWELCERFSV